MRPVGRFDIAHFTNICFWILLLLTTDAADGSRLQHFVSTPPAVDAASRTTKHHHHCKNEHGTARLRTRAAVHVLRRVVVRGVNWRCSKEGETAPAPSLFALAATTAVMAQQHLRGGGGGSPSTMTTATATTASPTEVNPPSSSAAAAATKTNTSDTPGTKKKSSNSSSSSKLANFQQRLVPAVLLLVGLYVVVHRFRAPGLTVLLLLISPGLYHEAVSVVLQEPPSALERAFKWWWFVAASLATTVPQALEMLVMAPNPSSSSSSSATTTTTYNWPHVAHLAAYSMVAVGFMFWIYCLNAVPGAAVVHFQSAWNELAVYTMGVVFTVVPTAFWMAVLSSSAYDGMGWALYTALLVIVNDTMAYLFGFTMGQNPLLPTISPKKTWEGWLGAFASTVVLSLPLWKVLMKDTIYNRHSFVIALFCCIVAPFGGFLASSVKRAGGKKDFGDLMPGHGGLVDRLDCQLLAAPFLFLYLRAFVPHSTPAP